MYLKPSLLVTQGYSSKERKGALFNEWEFSEAGAAEQSEVLLSDICVDMSHAIFHAALLKLRIFPERKEKGPNGSELRSRTSTIKL